MPCPPWKTFRPMNIRGIYKTTLIDYPGKISAAIFTGGCNLKCRYCHNPGLVLGDDSECQFSEEEVLALLIKRKHLIEGLTISGGEPTLQKDLDLFIEKVKSIPLAVKLDTNGCAPDVLDNLISRGLLDYVAIDIKTSPYKYNELTGREIDFPQIRRSIDILRNSGIDYEVRTTCIPGYVTMDDFRAIKESVGHVKKYALQQFVNENCLIDARLQEISPYPVKVLLEFKQFVETFTDYCEIRGI